ncbi:MAG: hypothetical protein IGS03_02555 [Candidatus Sericytochromatia bacterium]|nr:hypothetical protein [Candidatus Sericytochromatia bacterium]
MAETGISALNLPKPLAAKVAAAGLEQLEQARDSTLPQLQQRGLQAREAEALLSAVDFYLDRRFRSEMLCPAWPTPCQDVACEFLEIPADLLAQLEENGLEYTYQLAFSRRYTLTQRWGTAAVEALEMALARFLNAWRSEEIVLEEVDDV